VTQALGSAARTILQTFDRAPQETPNQDLITKAKNNIKLARLVLNEEKKKKGLTAEIEAFINNTQTGDQARIDKSFKDLCIKVCEHRWKVSLEGKTSNVFVAYVTKNFNRLAEFMFGSIKGGRLESIRNRFKAATRDTTPLLDLKTKSAKGFIKLLTDNEPLRIAVGIDAKQDVKSAIENKIKEVLDAKNTPNSTPQP